MLAFRITYLTGAARAADVRTGHDKSEPEWPPHPSRFFSALVSAWAAAGVQVSGRAALEWLERQAPPVLVVSPWTQRTPVVSFVPANDDPGLIGTRARNPRRFPVAVPESDTVYMTWPGVEPSAEHRHELAGMAKLVPALGHSSSLVDVRLVETAPSPDLVPAQSGKFWLRVPAPGRLAHLEALFDAGRRPDAGHWQAYAPLVDSAPPPWYGVFDEVIAHRLETEGMQMPLSATLNVCRALRGAVLAHAESPISEVISGHAPGSTPERPLVSDRPHLAFAPLPDVGHAHARGHIMGLAAILPRTLDPSERAACLRALGRVQELVLGKLGRFPIGRVTLDEARRGLLPGTWSGPARVWATVTPIVLDRFPGDPFGSEAERVVVQSCLRVGLPEPSEVVLGKVSWILGVPRASDFPARSDRPGRPLRYHLHARLTFDRPVTGPVLVGAGRYYGYGFCRPLGRHA